MDVPILSTLQGIEYRVSTLFKEIGFPASDPVRNVVYVTKTLPVPTWKTNSLSRGSSQKNPRWQMCKNVPEGDRDIDISLVSTDGASKIRLARC